MCRKSERAEERQAGRQQQVVADPSSFSRKATVNRFVVVEKRQAEVIRQGQAAAAGSRGSRA